MRRWLTWLVVTLGIAAIVRRLRRRSARAEDTSAPSVAEPPSAPTEDPADELRRKLAESRAPDEQQASEPAEPPVSEASVEERRAGIHDQGRSALDEMRDSDEA